MRLIPFRHCFSHLLAALLLSCVLLPSQASASDSSMLFILDGSGSMWGRVGGRSKIEAAKDVLTKLLSELPADQSAGLMAYGHRRKGDCADIEMLLPVQAGQGKPLAEAVQGLLPKGKTPIADALTQAAESLKGREGASSLILVSDGKETCGGDPCAVAESLHASGANLKIYVVGFQVTGEDVEQLRCIAEKGGGRYFQADDTASLAQALTSIQEHVVKSEPLPEPVPVPEAPAQPEIAQQAGTTTKIKLKTIGSIKLEPAPWVRMPPKNWKIVDAESGEEMGTGQSDAIRIKPGAYQILWRQVEHGSKETPLTETVFVDSGETATVKLDTGLRLTAPKGIGPAYYWKLLDDQGQVAAHFWGDETFQAQLAPAGNHRLVWRQTEHETGEADLGPVDIITGQLTDKVLDSGVVMSLPEWLKEPYGCVLTNVEGREFFLRIQGPQLLGPGTYKLTWRQTEHSHSPVSWGEITVPEHEFATLPVHSGLVFLAGEQALPYRIIAVNTETGQKCQMQESWGPMPLPPGQYSLELQETQHGSEPIRLADDLPVCENELLELEF